MISFYIFSERFFLKRKGLSDTRVVSITKKGYGFAAISVQTFIKCLELTSDEELILIC